MAFIEKERGQLPPSFSDTCRLSQSISSPGSFEQDPGTAHVRDRFDTGFQISSSAAGHMI